MYRLKVEKNTGFLFFRNPFPQISTFSLEQEGCAHYWKSAYYEWAQYLMSTPRTCFLNTGVSGILYRPCSFS